ncbi:D-amino acid dehydrogenase [Marinomonas piezotolerans]|uniref:D-amino acid dehydrogenase n=1 Tax=Marinomonas piezotolerans TaxID=2213058 RepID=A0A370U4D8_9GAMM|nr:D-amino acid dehydrogenase [Marinomonas piezotolerans]RDL42642.1 D-amino acid dehydrogenase [Marinomonas piezotolerans]
MKVCVLGAGVVGLTAAYYLAKRGMAVTVVDRQPGVALEASFANAGQISPGYSAPWAAPGIPLKALKWLTQKRAPLKISPEPELNKVVWMSQMLRNCTSQKYSVNKSRMMALAEYSRDCFIELRSEIGIRYDDNQKGLTQLFRSNEQVDGAIKDISVLKALGVPHEVLTPEAILKVEPGLAPVIHKFKGALRLTGDETGDCHKFCEALKSECDKLNVEFQFSTSIQQLLVDQKKVRGVSTDKSIIECDQVLMCLGSYSKEMLKEAGISVPIYPVKGYSLTVPISNNDYAPTSTVMDETYKVAITRLGDRVRAAGTAELSGFNLSMPKARTDTISYVVGDVFPQAGDLSEAEFWTGLRPMTPDGTPIVGATGIEGLYLNTGHGTLGWTMSCGSAALITDIMLGEQTAIDATNLAVQRYQK